MLSRERGLHRSAINAFTDIKVQWIHQVNASFAQDCGTTPSNYLGEKRGTRAVFLTQTLGWADTTMSTLRRGMGFVPC
jgi:hypothetical protein